MSYFDPINYQSYVEKVNYITAQSIRIACTTRGYSYEEAALKCGIDLHEFGMMANGHKDIPKEYLFKLMQGLDFPKGFFYKLCWEARYEVEMIEDKFNQLIILCGLCGALIILVKYLIINF